MSAPLRRWIRYALGGVLLLWAGIGAAQPVTPSFPRGQQAMTTSLSVAIASDQSAIPVTVSAVEITVFPDNEPFNLAQIGGAAFAQAQRTTANSVSVTLSSDHGTLPALAANQSVNLTQVNSVALASPFDLDTGGGTESVPGVSLRLAAAGGSVAFGTSTDPVRVDPTGTTTQPVSLSAANFPDNEPFNLNQIGGAAVLTGNGVTGTGSPRVTIASDNTAFTVNIGTFPDNEPVNVAQFGGTSVNTGTGTSGTGTPRVTVAQDSFLDPCGRNTKSYVGINQTAGAQLITGVAATRIYVCSFNLVSATAQNIAVVAGTGTTCATTTVGVPGLTGGSTAATGWNLVANTGLTFGNGAAALAQTTVNADNLCLLQSGSGQVSGGLSYVTQ